MRCWGLGRDRGCCRAAPLANKSSLAGIEYRLYAGDSSYHAQAAIAAAMVWFSAAKSIG